MLFVLRVVLVVGALSYFALMRSDKDPAGEARKLVALPSVGALLPVAAAALPAETRDKTVRDALARGLMAELSRRAGESDPAPLSRDTLNADDRTPVWRGVDRR